MEIRGAAAIVTGGASGLGRATAIMLADAGARVTVLDLADDLEEIAGYPGVTALGVDVTDDEQLGAAISTAAVGPHPLRIAVSCAGIGASMRAVGRDGAVHSRRVWNKVIAVNLNGAFHLLTHAAAHIGKTAPVDPHGQRGVVVFTTSIAATDGQRGQIAYAASKAGITGMTLPAARDLSQTGVRVCSIAPGSMETPLLAKLTDEQREGLVAGASQPRRLGRPEEFAALVRHVVENDYLNGTTIRLDAGLRMPPS